ncbi:MAG TPA: extracellular solute-binding protein [Gammaproteobacteria bacterium]|nr:extracellular solute-binding protein [Gammaproteobacteria bacterium]
MKLRRLAALFAAATMMLFGASIQAKELFLYNWSNYLPPDLIEKFEKETGIKVTLDVYDSNETMLAKLQAGATGYDLVVPSGYMVRNMIKAGMAEKIDVSELPNFKNVMKPHDSPPFDPKSEYSAPYMWGTTGITYDSAKVPGGQLEHSWKEFFQPRPEIVGQVVALNDQVEVWNAAAYYLGLDKCTEDPKEAQKILDLLEAQKPKLAMYSSSGTIDRMVAGEVAMHHQWNGASHRVREKLPTARYLYPKEGISLWGDHLVVPKGAKNIENAKAFINFMMDPENVAVASNFTGYMNAIKGSGKYLDDSLKSDPAVNMPEEYAGRLSPTKDCSKEARELRDRVWTKLKK